MHFELMLNLTFLAALAWIVWGIIHYTRNLDKQKEAKK